MRVAALPVLLGLVAVCRALPTPETEVETLEKRVDLGVPLSWRVRSDPAYPETTSDLIDAAPRTLGHL